MNTRLIKLYQEEIFFSHEQGRTPLLQAVILSPSLSVKFCVILSSDGSQGSAATESVAVVWKRSLRHVNILLPPGADKDPLWGGASNHRVWRLPCHLEEFPLCHSDHRTSCLSGILQNNKLTFILPKAGWFFLGSGLLWKSSLWTIQQVKRLCLKSDKLVIYLNSKREYSWIIIGPPFVKRGWETPLE